MFYILKFTKGSLNFTSKLLKPRHQVFLAVQQSVVLYLGTATILSAFSFLSYEYFRVYQVSGLQFEVMNKATMNVFIQIFLYAYVFISPGQVDR